MLKFMLTLFILYNIPNLIFSHQLSRNIWRIIHGLIQINFMLSAVLLDGELASCLAMREVSDIALPVL